jgi:hypothetical protein
LIVVQIAHVRARRPARAWQRHVISFLACHAMPCHAMPAVVHVLYLTRPHYLACCCRPVLPPAVLLCFVQSCRVQSSHTHTHTHTYILLLILILFSRFFCASCLVHALALISSTYLASTRHTIPPRLTGTSPHPPSHPPTSPESGSALARLPRPKHGLPACPLPARQSIDRSLFTPSCVQKTPCVSLSRAVQSCSAAT